MPAVDAVEALAAKYASDWPACGHRKIAAMMWADGHEVSTSTVERALRRRGLLLPRGFRADRKSWAALRRKVFHDPPTERNRVWQTDFSEFETPGDEIWRICAVIDYATKYCLATKINQPVAARTRWRASTRPLPRPNAFSGSWIYGRTAASWSWSTRTPVRSSTSSRPRSPSSPTTAPAFAARPARPRSPARTRCCVTSAPASDRRRPTASSNAGASPVPLQVV
jgi:hypothetical protein